MAFCKNCGAQLADGNVFCAACGAPVASAQAGNNTQNSNGAQQNYQQQYAAPPPPMPAPTDHTADYDPADISKNKVVAMAPYLLGVFGLLIALLAAPQSPFVTFHSREALKITILQTLLGIIAVVLVWTIIVPLAAFVCLIILLVVDVICFFNVCGGKAKEAPIVSSFTFLK